MNCASVPRDLVTRPAAPGVGPNPPYAFGWIYGFSAPLSTDPSGSGGQGSRATRRWVKRNQACPGRRAVATALIVGAAVSTGFGPAIFREANDAEEKDGTRTARREPRNLQAT